MVRFAQKRLLIMAAGVSSNDVREIIEKTGVDEVHSAASTSRPSQMQYVKAEAKMGHGDDFSLTVVNGDMVKAIKDNIIGL
jgi:copper homeostasis protein